MRLHADEEKGEREAGVGLRNVWGGGVVGRGGRRHSLARKQHHIIFLFSERGGASLFISIYLPRPKRVAMGR